MASLMTAYVRLALAPDTRVTFQKQADKEVGAATSTLGTKHGKKYGQAFSSSAKTFFSGTAGLIAALGVAKFATDSIKAAQESAKVSAQTAAVIKSTGGAAHVTAGQISNLATALMKKTGVDDEAIKSGQNMLLTFTRIRNAAGKNNDIFNQSSKILLDMTAAMNGGNVTQENMRKQAIQLGKALNDPVKGLTALQRVGVTFTDQQKKQIAQMVKSGNTLGAQKVILRELTKEFGGSAAAMATPAEKMKTAFGEIEEGVGGALIPIIDMLAKFLLKSIIPALNTFLPALSKLGQQAIPYVTQAINYMILGLKTIGGLFASLPAPVKIAIAAFVALRIAMMLAAAANPWILLATTIVLVVGIIAKNWSKIRTVTTEVWHAILGYVSGVWDWIRGHWPLLLAILTGPFGLAVKFIIDHWNTIKTVTARLIQVLRNAFANFVNALLGFFGAIVHGAATAFGWIPGIGPKLKTAAKQFDQFRQNVTNSIRGINGRTVDVGVQFTAIGVGPFAGKRVAAGGPIKGPGGPTDDKAGLFALSNDEYVVRASAHRKYGTQFLNAVNAGRLAAGGPVGLDIRATTPSASLIASQLLAQIVKLARSSASSLGAIGGGGPVSADANAAMRFAMAVLGRFGWSAAQFPALRALWTGESGWNRNAYNASSGAFGIPQALPFTKMPHAAWPTFAGGQASAAAQILWGLSYIRSVYGSPSAAYGSWLSRSPHWYGRGGIISEPIIGVGRSGRRYVFGENGDETVIPGRTGVGPGVQFGDVHVYDQSDYKAVEQQLTWAWMRAVP